jgi:hypothetical protein
MRVSSNDLFIAWIGDQILFSCIQEYIQRMHCQALNIHYTFAMKPDNKRSSAEAASNTTRNRSAELREAIEEMIAIGQLAPGDHLDETLLATHFDVSRTNSRSLDPARFNGADQDASAARRRGRRDRTATTGRDV